MYFEYLRVFKSTNWFCESQNQGLDGDPPLPAQYTAGAAGQLYPVVGSNSADPDKVEIRYLMSVLSLYDFIA